MCLQSTQSSKHSLNQPVPSCLCCRSPSPLSDGDVARLSSSNRVVVVIAVAEVVIREVSWHAGTVVQSDTGADDLASFVRCHSQFRVQTMPATLQDADAALDRAAGTTQCRVVRIVLHVASVEERSQQPVTKHVAAVAQNETVQRLRVSFERSEDGRLPQNTSIVNRPGPLGDAVDDVHVSITDELSITQT